MYSQKHSVVKIDRGDSTLSSGINIKLIATVVAGENAFKVQDYETILMFFLRSEVLMVSTQ